MDSAGVNESTQAVPKLFEWKDRKQRVKSRRRILRKLKPSLKKLKKLNRQILVGDDAELPEELKKSHPLALALLIAMYDNDYYAMHTLMMVIYKAKCKLHDEPLVPLILYRTVAMGEKHLYKAICRLLRSDADFDVKLIKEEYLKMNNVAKWIFNSEEMQLVSGYRFPSLFRGIKSKRCKFIDNIIDWVHKGINVNSISDLRRSLPELLAVAIKEDKYMEWMEQFMKHTSQLEILESIFRPEDFSIPIIESGNTIRILDDFRSVLSAKQLSCILGSTVSSMSRESGQDIMLDLISYAITHGLEIGLDPAQVVISGLARDSMDIVQYCLQRDLGRYAEPILQISITDLFARHTRTICDMTMECFRSHPSKLKILAKKICWFLSFNMDAGLLYYLAEKHKDVISMISDEIWMKECKKIKNGISAMRLVKLLVDCLDDRKRLHDLGVEILVQCFNFAEKHWTGSFSTLDSIERVTEGNLLAHGYCDETVTILCMAVARCYRLRKYICPSTVFKYHVKMDEVAKYFGIENGDDMKLVEVYLQLYEDTCLGKRDLSIRGLEMAMGSIKLDKEQTKFRDSFSDAALEIREAENLMRTYKNLGKRVMKPLADDVCTICRDGEQRALLRLSCHETHVSHIDCLKTWFGKSLTCPVCRQKFVKNE